MPVWNTYRTTADFPPGRPWLLRFFDRIRFFPVAHAELDDWRAGVRHGTRRLDIREGSFSLADHDAFPAGIGPDVEAFRARQRDAFAAERERWAQAPPWREPPPAAPPSGAAEGPHGDPVTAHLAANVWRLAVAPGARVAAGDVVAILEAMKMEIPITAPRAGVVAAVACSPGDLVVPGQVVITLDADDREGA